jgi:type II secretory pathway component GspD/PulD (secretin)
LAGTSPGAGGFNPASAGGTLTNANTAPTPAGNPERNTKHEQLMKLVTGMVRPLTWEANATGGPGKLEYYDIGSALVVNQTADVIREVGELLEALRRLQDLAVAVEVRVISLSETFFERMGVDFAVNVKTKNTSFEPNLTNGVFRPEPFVNDINNQGVTVGLTPAGGGGNNGTRFAFTPDLDVPIAATSFPYAIPGFGGYPNAPGANGGLSLGLAFLNDIQVFMFMEAAQGNRRINVMQAPKLTLFNGQSSTIAVSTVTYYVNNVQVFSVNGQVVFVPLNTPFPIGTPQNGSPAVALAIQAVISADRRFVRLNCNFQLSTLAGATVPLFPITTFITAVFDTGSQGVPIPFTQFIQQPDIANIFLNTTVVCPDGGTVLVGGLKYLAEGRNEFGPPFFSKVPYLNRLVKNVGIGRETVHLMLMITPRIIITAEEEIRQTEGGAGIFQQQP